MKTLDKETLQEIESKISEIKATAEWIREWKSNEDFNTVEGRMELREVARDLQRAAEVLEELV